ncbi:type IV pilin [Halobacteriales archaeon Cl-PHB]
MFARFHSKREGQVHLVGFLLLVVVTLLLVAVIATFVFGLGGQDRQTAPNANFSVSLQQEVPDNRTDSFGSNGTGFEAVLQITHTEGEAVPAEQLWIRGASSIDQPRSWADTNASTNYSTFEPGTTIGTGDSLAVWVDLNDTVRVTWTSSTGNESATLHVWGGGTE